MKFISAIQVILISSKARSVFGSSIRRRASVGNEHKRQLAVSVSGSANANAGSASSASASGSSSSPSSGLFSKADDYDCDDVCEVGGGGALVCGVDGNTYFNECFAICQDIEIERNGACPSDPPMHTDSYITGTGGKVTEEEMDAYKADEFKLVAKRKSNPNPNSGKFLPDMDMEPVFNGDPDGPGNSDGSGNGNGSRNGNGGGGGGGGGGMVMNAYNANHGEDSRLIAYVGNWQQCPTDDQVDAYSHIVIAFASSYTWTPEQNNCNQQCQVPSSLPTCENRARPDLIQKWRNMGKKVIVSFGGAGMGGSWPGDKNNCWDYCFGREDQLSTDLVNIVKGQNLDGIDIDYEYCYDVAGRQAGRCAQRSSLYSDAKAQRFLNSLTSSLRTKLDILRAGNGYNRGRYELTHAPMDLDLVHDSKYFGILRERRADLDYLMPQFYNGSTRAGTDGFDGSGAGRIKASTIYSSLANNLFDREPNKVVFGHCISDCSGTGSNVNANQAVQIQKQIKEYNNGEFKCNGGAFFWVADHDVGGAWSDQVVREVSLTSGCSKSQPQHTPTSTNAGKPFPDMVMEPFFNGDPGNSDGDGRGNGNDNGGGGGGVVMGMGIIGILVLLGLRDST